MHKMIQTLGKLFGPVLIKPIEIELFNKLLLYHANNLITLDEIDWHFAFKFELCKIIKTKL